MKPNFTDLYIHIYSGHELYSFFGPDEIVKINVSSNTCSDLSIIYAHRTGEILFTDTKKIIFTGLFIDMMRLNVNESLFIWDDKCDNYVEYKSYVIESIYRGKI